MAELVLAVILFCFIILWPQARKVFFANPEAQEASIKKREPFFDLAKGIAILAVILIHVEDKYAFAVGGENLFLLSLDVLSRFALPIFFLCSGILLSQDLSNKEKIIYFYKKKFIRIFVPFIAFTFAISYVDGFAVKEFLYNLYTGQALAPYYFLIILLQLYLVYPILLAYKDSKYFLVATFFISIAFNFFQPANYFDIPFFARFLFFFSYGIARKDKFLSGQPLSKKEAQVWGGILVLFLFVFFYQQIQLSNATYFYGLAVFHLLFYFKDKLLGYFAVGKNLLLSFGRNSLWIYLAHYVIVDLAYAILHLFFSNQYILLALMFVFTVGISYLLALLFARIYNQSLFNYNNQ